jgi:hypothetical protein
MNVSNTNQRELLNSIIPDGNNSATHIKEVANAVKALQDVANSTTTIPLSGQDRTDMLAHLTKLGITPTITTDNLDAYLNAIKSATASGADSLTELNSIADAVVNGVANLAQNAIDNNATTDASSLGAMGITDANTSNMDELNSFLNSADIAGTDVDTTTKLQALNDAVNAIINSGSEVNATQLETLGLDDDMNTSDLDQLSLFNSVTPDANNTAENLALLAQASKAVQDVASGTTSLDLNSADATAMIVHLAKLGVTPTITADNLDAYMEQVKNAGVSGADTIAKLKNLATVQKNNVNTIVSGATDNNATVSASDLNTTGITDVNSSNIDELNTFLNSSDINGSDVNTTKKIQSLNDAVNNIINADTNVTATQLETLGLSTDDINASNINALALFNSVTPATDNNNSAANLELLAQAAQAVIDTATNGTTGTPTLAQLTALGITDVNATNLSAVQQAIRSASAADVSPLTDLQTLITGAIADLTAITAGTGAEVNFTDINITDVNSSNIGAINSAINDANTSASTKEEVQTIVDSYNVLLALANGLDDNGTNASQTDFENIGISEVNTTQEVSLLSSIIDEKSSTDVNTTTKISALAQIVDKIMNAAAGNTPTPTASDLANIGIQGVTADNLDSYLAQLAATADDGSAVDTLDNLRVLATNDVPTVSTTATGNGFIVNGDGVSVFKDTNISTVEISQRIISIELNATNITDTNETLEVNGTVVNMNVAQVTTALNTIGDYNVTIDGNTSTIVLSDLNLTQTQANSLIDTIKYKNTDSTPTKGDRVITLAKVQDNGGTAYSGVDTWSTSVSSTINVDNISFVISGSANEGSESGQTLNISNLIGATFDSSSDL